MMMATSIKKAKSLANKLVSWVNVAPNTFLIPTSLTLLCRANVTNPNKPRQEMKMASPANPGTKVLTNCSVSYSSL